MTDKEEFLNICKCVEREGFDELLAWLDTTDFYTAPASTKYHGAFEGGLLKHSLNVYKMLVRVGVQGISNESLVLVSLFHDLCKVNFYKTDFRNTKNESGAWVKTPYYTVDEKFPYGHGEKSVYILNSFIRLTNDEALAINAHMGGFDDRVKGGSFVVGNIFNICELALELHIADLRATYLLENVVDSK